MASDDSDDRDITPIYRKRTPLKTGRKNVYEQDLGPDHVREPLPLKPYQDIGMGVCFRCKDERRLYQSLVDRTKIPKCADCTTREDRI